MAVEVAHLKGKGKFVELERQDDVLGCSFFAVATHYCHNALFLQTILNLGVIRVEAFTLRDHASDSVAMVMFCGEHRHVINFLDS